MTPEQRIKLAALQTEQPRGRRLVVMRTGERLPQQIALDLRKTDTARGEIARAERR